MTKKQKKLMAAIDELIRATLNLTQQDIERTRKRTHPKVSELPYDRLWGEFCSSRVRVKWLLHIDVGSCPLPDDIARKVHP